MLWYFDTTKNPASSLELHFCKQISSIIIDTLDREIKRFYHSSWSKASTKGLMTPALTIIEMGGFCSRDSILRAARAAFVFLVRSCDLSSVWIEINWLILIILKRCFQCTTECVLSNVQQVIEKSCLAWHLRFEQY